MTSNEQVREALARMSRTDRLHADYLARRWADPHDPIDADTIIHLATGLGRRAT